MPGHKTTPVVANNDRTCEVFGPNHRLDVADQIPDRIRRSGVWLLAEVIAA